MKRKLSALFLSLFLVFALWAQNPTKDFPYYYYDSTEYSYYDYGLSAYNKIKEIRNDETWTITLYRKDNTDYIVFKYNEKAPTEKDIKRMLERNKSVWKNYDKENGSPGVCHIFLDSKGSFICSAEYSEDY